MQPLRQHHRWTPWWLATLFGVLYIPLAYAVVLAIVDPKSGGEGIRIVIPLFAILSYWVLALVANFRTAVVKPSGVRVSMFPFPVGTGQWVNRADVAVCYARHIVEYHRGVEIENFFTAGIQTGKGQQIDVYVKLKTAADALQFAHDIGRVLNANPAERPIDVRTVPRAATDSTFRLLGLAWLAATFLAVLLGAAWELKYGTL